jgi:hypothetical protein
MYPNAITLDKNEVARTRLHKLFDAALSKEAMGAIDKLLKAMNLDNKKKAKPNKKKIMPLRA